MSDGNTPLELSCQYIAFVQEENQLDLSKCGEFGDDPNEKRQRQGTLARSFDETTAFQSKYVSSRRFTLGSSSSVSSKTEMGAIKMMACTSMKYGYHAER